MWLFSRNYYISITYYNWLQRTCGKMQKIDRKHNVHFKTSFSFMTIHHQTNDIKCNINCRSPNTLNAIWMWWVPAMSGSIWCLMFAVCIIVMQWRTNNEYIECMKLLLIVLVIDQWYHLHISNVLKTVS